MSLCHRFLSVCAISLLVPLHISFFDVTPVAPVRAGPSTPGFGPLVPDPEGVLDLPQGFSYKVISRRGDEMEDGLLVPGRPDGMGAFPGPDGLTIVIRNHELYPFQNGAFGHDNVRYRESDRDKFYDAGFRRRPIPGGTTTLVFDTRTQTLVRQFLSLAGTIQNCGGGPTPWNTWISCEETAQRAHRSRRFITEQDHGYNFEVPATADIGLTEPVPLKAMGRFMHEAVTVDPRTGIVYQTEDRHDGLIYRFIPKEPGRLRAGGRLQALAIVGQPRRDTRNWRRHGRPVPPRVVVGQRMAVEWIDLEDIDSPKDDLRYRGFRAGAARFACGEGMCIAGGDVFFACTSGGRDHIGQIWRYLPSSSEGTEAEREHPAMLELFSEPNDARLITAADNLCTAPWGDVLLCEDPDGREVRLVGLTLAGEYYFIARQYLESEFAGACFSPDGSTLFVNVQKAGLTFAITGPWEKNLRRGAGAR